jgi:perosamine synthetase
VLTLSNHGRARGQIKQFWPDMVGFKYKMSNIQAAIGCAQMERISELIARKKDILINYQKRLDKLSGILLNPESERKINGAWMPTIVFAPELGITRHDLQTVFKQENIDARIFFWPLSSTGIFQIKHSNPISNSICNRAINLPSYHDITLGEQSRICSIIKHLLRCENTDV